MTPFAHAGHWLESVVYLVPIGGFALWLLVSSVRDKRRGRGDGSDPEPPKTPDGSPGTLLVIAAAVASLALLASSEPALAHGIHASAAGKSVLEFIPLGIKHMLLGWDHLLFIFGIVILAGNLRRAAKLISLFVAGHSLTLLVATIAGWKLDATLVDVVIALSLVYVGVQGIRSRRMPGTADGSAIFTKVTAEQTENWRLIAGVVFAFGLVHGLGLSTRLQDLGLPDDGLVWRVIAFNVGVEIGQLLALSAVVAVGYFVLPVVDWPKVRRAAFAMLVATGLVASAVLSFPGDEGGDANAQRASDVCEQRDVDPPGSSAGGHPGKRFYGPDEAAPTTDLEHIIGDGFVVVLYRPDIAERDRQALVGWLERSPQLVAAADPGQDEALKATTASRELSCTRVDMRTLTAFTDTWLEDVQTGRVQ